MSGLETSIPVERLSKRFGLGRLQLRTSGPFVREGAEVVVATRPERIALSEAPCGPGGNAVRRVVRNSACLGDRRHVYVSVEGGEQPLAAAAQETQAEAGRHLGEAGAAWISRPGGSLVLLEPSGG